MGATPQDDLREELVAGQVVVIVGAGVLVAATGGAPTASWIGLLNDAVAYCEALLGPSLPSGWGERRRAQVASGDLDELVGAAEDLTRRLGGPAGGEFGRWLAGSIGTLSPASPAVLEALAALPVSLATTNYDGLLETMTGRPAVTWRQSALFEQVLRGDIEAILHLHGHWQDPESVVLGVRSYEAVVGNTHAEAMRKALASTKTLVFVGCGAGLEDPNFGALRRWLAGVFAGSPYRHYRLCLQQELADLWREHGLDERIVPVAYGERHDDLAPFLQRLVFNYGTGPSASAAISSAASPQQERHAPRALPRIWMSARSANSMEGRNPDRPPYDVFLSHSHSDSRWVESLAERLEDERGFKVWLDRWVLTPGKTWQQEMAKGLESTQTCVVCLGQSTPRGWFDQEIQRALDIQTRNPDYRVIPLLLPDAPGDVDSKGIAFLTLRTWADFRAGQEIEYAFHVLCQGILGQPIGRWSARRSAVVDVRVIDETSEQLRVLVKLRDEAGLDEKVFREYQRKLVADLFSRGVRRSR